MKKAEAASLEERVRGAFPDGEIDRVDVLEYGDDPEIGPGESAIRVSLTMAGTPAGTARRERLVAFRDANRGALDKLRHQLRSQAWWIEYRAGGPDEPGSGSFRSLLRDEAEGPADLTPVMTRLGTADLATVDTLIAAGIGTSRAEVLRWAVGRVRENPAYDQLCERIQQLEELKARF
jgi:hypothetical protein